MSSRLAHDTTVALTEGATPATIAAAITAGLTELEDRVKSAGRRAIWDTTEITTDTEVIDEGTFDRPRASTEYRLLTISVLTVDPSEVSS